MAIFWLYDYILYGIVFGGTTTPILFQWLVSRNVIICVPSFHDNIIPIFTFLLLVLIHIHFRGFICSMNKTERIILVRIKPILLPNIIRKSSPQTKAKNTFILFFISYFQFFIFKFIEDLSYLKSFYIVLCFLFSCIFPLSSNYRHDKLTNKEHKLQIKGAELCKHAQRKKRQTLYIKLYKIWTIWLHFGYMVILIYMAK